jgi:hypothetical protein
MDDLDLAKYDPETLAKAKYVQDKIFERGLKPVRFMRTAAWYARREGPRLIAREIRREFN